MEINNIQFGVTDWTTVEPTEIKGETGTSYWRSLQFGDINVHQAEYSADYQSDHWCHKGHILLCVQGELRTELQDGREFILKPGMSYQVADNEIAHKSSTITGAKLFIVD